MSQGEVAASARFFECASSGLSRRAVNKGLTTLRSQNAVGSSGTTAPPAVQGWKTGRGKDGMRPSNWPNVTHTLCGWTHVLIGQFVLRGGATGPRRTHTFASQRCSRTGKNGERKKGATSQHMIPPLNNFNFCVNRGQSTSSASKK